MIQWLHASQAQSRLLPGGKMRGPTPWVIAIMTFVMMIVTAAALALAGAAGSVADQSRGRFVLQVPGGTDLHQAVRLLQAEPGISGVVQVPEQEMRRSLQRWLGPSAASEDLPVPALIHFDLVDQDRVGRLSATFAARMPGSRISSHGEEVRPLVATMSALRWVAIGLVLLMALATSATIVLAARGALESNRPTIDVLHGIGATDTQVTALFQRKIALDAAIGASVGAAAAALTLLFLLGGKALAAIELGGAGVLGPLDVVILLLLPVVIAVLATWVARSAVLAALRKDI